MIWAVHLDGSVIARNLRSAMSTYSRSTEEGSLLDLGPASASSSGVNYAVFNALVVSEPVTVTRLSSLLDQGEEFYRKRGLGWSCWLDEKMIDPQGGPQAAHLLQSRGMQWVAQHDGMLTAEIRRDRGQLPAVATRPVADQQTRDNFIQVCCQVFLLPESITKRIYGSASFWSGLMRGWVGYDGVRPVCIAVSAADDGSVGLYSVATLPAYRRRGFGEFITRHAIGEAAQRSGLNRWSLQSTPEGIGLYRRLGYQARTRISVWASE